MKRNHRHTGTERTEETDDSKVNEDKEFRRKKESEILSKGVSHVTHESDEVPPLATRVASLPEAVDLALKMGVDENCLFNFARALMAFEATTDFKLPPDQREQAFALWWTIARPLLPADVDFDEYRFMFYDAVAQARTPHGANPLKEAISRADAKPMPPEAARYTSASIRRLVAVCHHLQVLQGNSDIFLGLRDAQSISGVKSLRSAGQLLDGLIHDGVLERTSKGTPGGRLASRYRFIGKAPISAPPVRDRPIH